MTDEFGNDEYAIRQVALLAHIRGDFEAERIALDRLARMERESICSDCPGGRMCCITQAMIIEDDY